MAWSDGHSMCVQGVLWLLLCGVSCCRPYGVASLLAVHDKEAGAQLYVVEPSGVLNTKLFRFQSSVQSICRWGSHPRRNGLCYK